MEHLGGKNIKAEPASDTVISDNSDGSQPHLTDQMQIQITNAKVEVSNVDKAPSFYTEKLSVELNRTESFIDAMEIVKENMETTEESKLASAVMDKENAKEKEKDKDMQHPIQIEVIGDLRILYSYWPLFYEPNLEQGTKMVLVKNHSASCMKISPNGLAAFNSSGYQTARSAFGVHSGTFYFEITATTNFLNAPPVEENVNSLNCTTTSGTSNANVASSSNTALSGGSSSGNQFTCPHWRIGWSTEKSDIEASVGFDVYGYSFRDVDGSIVHKGKRTPYAHRGWGNKDVIGCLIHIPTQDHLYTKCYKPKTEAPKSHALSLTRYPATRQPTNVWKGSYIRFSINGEWLPKAFENLWEGVYYPSISLYYGAAVEVRFDDFQYSPPEGKGLACLPLNAAAPKPPCLPPPLPPPGVGLQQLISELPEHLLAVPIVAEPEPEPEYIKTTEKKRKKVK